MYAAKGVRMPVAGEFGTGASVLASGPAVRGKDLGRRGRTAGRRSRPELVPNGTDIVSVLAAVASALLILEFSLSAISMLSVMQVAVDRISQLIRITPSPGTVFLIGLLDLIGVTGVIAGFWHPLPAVAAGCFFALLSGAVLVRQTACGDRGSALLPYTLFLTASVVLIATRTLAGTG